MRISSDSNTNSLLFIFPRKHVKKRTGDKKLKFFYGEKWSEIFLWGKMVMWELYFEKGTQLGRNRDGFVESDSILMQTFAINQVATWKENGRSGNLEIKTRKPNIY